VLSAASSTSSAKAGKLAREKEKKRQSHMLFLIPAGADGLGSRGSGEKMMLG
jgi:hypothetical protein